VRRRQVKPTIFCRQSQAKSTAPRCHGLDDKGKPSAPKLSASVPAAAYANFLVTIGTDSKRLIGYTICSGSLARLVLDFDLQPRVFTDGNRQTRFSRIARNRVSYALRGRPRRRFFGCGGEALFFFEDLLRASLSKSSKVCGVPGIFSGCRWSHTPRPRSPNSPASCEERSLLIDRESNPAQRSGHRN
jgi:hypothetical protein